MKVTTIQILYYAELMYTVE